MRETRPPRPGARGRRAPRPRSRPIGFPPSPRIIKSARPLAPAPSSDRASPIRPSPPNPLRLALSPIVPLTPPRPLPFLPPPLPPPSSPPARSLARSLRNPGPPLHIERPLYPPLPPGASAPKLAKLTNIAGVESRPFDPATFDPASDGHERHHNVIRWRRVTDPSTGESTLESNARFVRWSDGSLQLLVGSETLAVTEASAEEEHQYVYQRHPGVIQAQAKIEHKLSFRPTSLKGETHKRLVDTIDKRHVKSARTMLHVEVQDPERAKEEADREAERLVREQEQLRKKQREAMTGRGRYNAEGGSRDGKVPAGYREYFDRGAGMDGAFLEADEDEEEDDREGGGDEGEGEGDLAAAEKAAAIVRAEAPAPAGGYDDEAAFDEEDEEEAAAAPAKEEARKKKRGRAIESDSEDE